LAFGRYFGFLGYQPEYGGMRAKRYQSLDGLRGACALSVLLFYAADMFRRGPRLAYGYIAVTLFCPLLVAQFIRSDHMAPTIVGPVSRLSYPLYTTHHGIIFLAQGTPLFGPDRGPDPLRAAGVVMLCIAAAWAVHVLAGARRQRAAATTQSA
jgi:peptidoglycan/LPS O-acetylase OafA/YrhL